MKKIFILKKPKEKKEKQKRKNEKTFSDRGSGLLDFIGHSSWNSSWI